MKSHEERRASPRFELSSDVRFLLRGTGEGAGKLLNMSECGLALVAESDAQEGDEVVVYPDGIGRIPGQVARTFEGGFCVAFTLSETQKPTMKDRLAAAIRGLPYFRLSEQRSSVRIRHNVETHVRLGDRKELAPCVIVDLSRTGCRVKCDQRPAIGSHTVVGALYSRVTRHTKDGFAVEFVSSPTITDADTVKNCKPRPQRGAKRPPDEIDLLNELKKQSGQTS